MCPNIDAARRDLHFQPRVALQEGLARTVAWYRDHLQSGSRRMTA
jgi:nucleoside-diphosphate-sugar epimerase